MYPSYCVGSSVLWLCARHDVDVGFPVWINSESAIKEITKILEHVNQVILLRFAKVDKLFDNVIHVHLFILGIQDGGSKAVWIVPVPAGELFFLAVYFEGFGHDDNHGVRRANTARELTRWRRLGASHEATDTLHHAMSLAPYCSVGMVIAFAVESVTFYFLVD